MKIEGNVCFSTKYVLPKWMSCITKKDARLMILWYFVLIVREKIISMLLELIQIIEKFGKPPDLFLPFNKLYMDVILDFWKSCKDSTEGLAIPSHHFPHC